MKSIENLKNIKERVFLLNFRLKLVFEEGTKKIQIQSINFSPS